MKLETLSTIIFILFFFINCFPQQKDDSLSLQEAIKITLTNHPLLQKALQQVNAAEARIKEQNSNYYPDIEGKISYTRIGPIPEIVFGGTGFELAPANNYDAYISASELIYDFGKRNSLVELNKSYKLSSEDKIDLIKNNLSYQTVRSYYTIIFLKRDIEVKKEQINTLKKHLDVTVKKLQSGTVTDFDTLTTQVRIAEVRNQLIDIENLLTKEEISLKSLLGWSSDKPLNLSGKLNIDTSLTGADALISRAIENRPEIKIAKDAEESAKAAKQAASLSERPNVNVIANYGLKNGYEPNLKVLRGNWAAGINASIPIFNGNLKDAKVEEAEANLKSSSADIRELERNIKTEVEQALADLNATRLKLKTTELQVQHAQRAVSRAVIQYRDGVITNLDLIDAETSLTQAKLMYYQVIYKNVLSYYNLKKAVGEFVR